MGLIDQRNWFAEHELEHCPRCRELNAIITPEVDAVVCIDCGFVGFRVAPAASEHDAA